MKKGKFQNMSNSYWIYMFIVVNGFFFYQKENRTLLLFDYLNSKNYYEKTNNVLM